MIQFDLPKEKASIIKVIGVGGGGSNAVNHMYNQGIKGVNFVICNTDSQALEMSPIPNKVQLGPSLTEGRGAGSNPEIGREACIESMEEIKQYLQANTKMVFITAGMGGGTGTGAAPIIAEMAKEMGILTVAIITTPFQFEGGRRKKYAIEGLEELRQHVDTILVVSNDKLREIYGNLSLSAAFSQADNILATAAKGIAEIITMPGYVNVDFEDVKTVMKESGVAIMGSALSEGENRADSVVQAALASPLLNDNDITGANYILLNISSGTNEVTMDEISEITEYIQAAAGNNVDIIWGNCYDESLGDKLSLTIIATGFEVNQQKKANNQLKNDKVVFSLTEENKESDQIDQASVVNKIKKVENQDSKEASAREKTQFIFEFDAPVKSDYKKEEKEIIQNKEQSKIEPKQNGYSQRPVTNTNLPINNVQPVPRLKSLNAKLRNPATLLEMEKQPAYLRRNIQLNNVPHSSDQSDMSRYTLSEPSEDEHEENRRPVLRKNNSFLHDNVD